MVSMQSPCQSTHVVRTLFVVTLLREGQYLAVPESGATSSGTTPALASVLDGYCL